MIKCRHLWVGISVNYDGYYSWCSNCGNLQIEKQDNTIVVKRHKLSSIISSQSRDYIIENKD